MRLHTVVAILLISLLAYDVSEIDGVAVLGIDLGSEWVRIGLVKPGVPMEIVLNKETRRKTPMSVYTSLKERLIGEDSLSAAIKRPSSTHKYFTRTVGALPRSPLVSEFQEDFPELELRPEEELAQYLVHKTGYSSEELIAMMLNHSRKLSEDFAEYYPIKDIVLTVPPFYTQAQRRAILRSADLVGIKVVSLINTNLAVALHYGSFQRDTYKDTPQILLFYDMGATASTATVVRYESGEGKSSAPKVTIMGTGFDRSLGGARVDKLLATHLAIEFEKEQANNNNKVDILNSHRAMAKLLKEAKRVKNVLSANTQHHAHIESITGDLDLKILVKRSMLEDLCEFTLFNRIPDIISEALEAAKISKEEIDLVVPVGGSFRLRKVAEIVLAELGKSEFTTTINADESAAMGAVYQGAFLSTGFRVKEIKLQDANVYPIEVSYEKKIAINLENETEGVEEEFKTKIVHKQLFYRSNILPQKKVMTFKNITDNLVLHASYVIDLPWLSENDRGVLTQGEAPEGRHIMRIEISGIQDAYSKYGQEESKGVKVHFSINENGLFQCTGAEAVFEKISTETSTIDSILGYFSSSSDDKVVEDNSTKQNETKPSINSTAPVDNVNTSNKSTTTTTTKPNILTYPLEIKTEYLDYPDPSEEVIALSKQRLLMLALKDEEKRLLELSQNNLEAFIYDLKGRLFTDETIALTSEDQRDFITGEIVKISDWFFDQGPDTPKEEYNDKFKELQSHTVDLFIRLRESKELPAALQKLNDTLNATANFIEHMEMYLNVSSMVFSEGDFTLITRQYNKTMDWLAAAQEEQSQLQPYENPSLTVSLVETQRYALESELRYLMSKLRNWKPPPAPKTPPMYPDDNGNNNNNEEEISIDIDDSEGEQQQQPPEEREETQQQQQQQQQPEQVVEEKQEPEIDLSNENPQTPPEEIEIPSSSSETKSSERTDL